MTASSVSSPFDARITEEVLAAMVPPRRPLVPGNSWSLRVQVRSSAGVALDVGPDNVSLVEMYVRGRLEPSTAPSLSRKSSVNRTGISPAAKQIVADSDQTAGLLDDEGNPKSGKGWLEIFFDPGDRALLVLLAGTPYFCVIVTWLSLQEETVLAGRITVKRQAKE